MVESILQERHAISERLHRDASYDAFDAMAEMSHTSTEYLSHLLGRVGVSGVFAGGSLGRSEMLPNSDVDLFIYDDPRGGCGAALPGILKYQFDKVEVAAIDPSGVEPLIRLTLVDGNRLVDARQIQDDVDPVFKHKITNANSHERQLANIVSEWRYFRNFDYIQKRDKNLGSNLKYSAGASRDLVFFDWLYRLEAGVTPSSDSSPDIPELTKAIEFFAGDNGRVLEHHRAAIDLILTVKNAAITNYDNTNDIRHRYVTDTAFEGVYALCRDKFKTANYENASDLYHAYRAARQYIETTTESLVDVAIINDASLLEIQTMLTMRDARPINRSMVAEATGVLDMDPSHAAVSLVCWGLICDGINDEELRIIQRKLQALDMSQSWGGIMALLCSEKITDVMLAEMTDWLYEKEQGAYLLKLVGRNPNASTQTKDRAVKFYNEKERMK